mgnify:CR=1 FL=1
MQKGLFIVVDGPSASGKDTIITQVIKDLKDIGLESVAIEETKDEKYDRKKILLAKEQGDEKIARTIIQERKRIYQAKVIPQLQEGAIAHTVGYLYNHPVNPGALIDVSFRHRPLTRHA